MKKLLTAVLTIGALTLATAAHAQVVSENYQFRGANATAGFYWSDSCSYGSAYISGGDNVTHMVRGAPVSSAYAYAYVWGYNWCTGESFNGWGWADAPGSTSVNQMNSATLSVPLTLSSWACHWVEDGGRGYGYWTCDYGTIGTGTFTANLTGTGDVTRSISMSQYSAGSYRSSSRSNGTWRQADGAGSLVINGRDYLDGAQAPWGSINDSSSSSHWFYHR